MPAETLAFDLRLTRPGFALAARAELPLAGVSVVFGPSGSGKTTLLRLIAGLERGEGRIALGGEVLADSSAGAFVPAHRRSVGLLFQEGRLFGHLSVAGNLAYAERRARPGAPALPRTEVIEALGVGGLLDRRPGALSGGERQRVALARALLARPRLLLLYEPLSALDLKARAAILPYLETVFVRTGLPVLHVTHSVDEAARLADRMVVMEAGRIAATGPAETMLARLDLDRLIGRFEAGARVEARVRAHDPAYGLTICEVEGVPLTVPGLAGLPAGARVRLRIRARDVALALAPPQGLSIQNVLPVTITEIVPEPDGHMADLRLALGTTGLRARLTRKAVDTLGLAPGIAAYALVKSVSFEPGG
ncbi:MAG: molybdenum ABC transporter ATP-binding protein [Alphaproteobacteria bacterium]|nr:molybdenum ABC transporter ATP-binding protein [Alphaproteobacteria bacterium]